MKILKSMIVALFLTSAFSFAQPRDCNANEDMQWIRDWNKAQHAQELAAALDLSDDQVTTLTGIKATVEEIKAAGEAARAEHDEQVAVTAAEVRANIETSGAMTEADEAALQALREAGRALRQDSRAQMAEATTGLRDLLTEDQVNAMREFAQANRPERGGEGRQGGEGFSRGQGGPQGFAAAPGGGQRGPRADRGGRGGNRGAQIARVLLSDAFLAYYE